MSLPELDSQQFTRTREGFLADKAFEWVDVRETRRVPESSEPMSGSVALTDTIIEQGLRLQYPDISEEELIDLREQQKLLAAKRIERIQIEMGNVSLGFLKAVHRTDMVMLGRNNVGTFTPINPSRPPADAAITFDPNVGIAINPADCPIISVFHAPKSLGRRGIGLIHAGYAGMAKGVIPLSLQRFQEAGFNPKDTYAYIQPHAINNYLLHGSSLQTVKDGGLTDFLSPTLDSEKMLFNMTAVVESQLADAGILLDHVVINRTDSMSDPGLYSHRNANQKGYAGRNALAIGIRAFN